MQFENRRILVIDDEASMHHDFRNILFTRKSPKEHEAADSLEAALFGTPERRPRIPFELSFASQGQEGLELSRRALEEAMPFAVAFVDMRMPPGWDGLRTIQELWSIDPNLQVVICTAYSDHSWDDTLSQLEAPHRLLVIRKPFDPIEVWQAAVTLSGKWTFERRAEAMIASLRNPRSHAAPGAPMQK